MPSYKAPTVDYQFLMHHVFDLESYNNLSPFKEASPDLIDAILEEDPDLDCFLEFQKEVISQWSDLD